MESRIRQGSGAKAALLARRKFFTRLHLLMISGLAASLFAQSGIYAQDAQTTEPVEQVLWDAYFSQAKTKQEKQALYEKLKQKYRITVLDADFFAGTNRY